MKKGIVLLYVILAMLLVTPLGSAVNSYTLAGPDSNGTDDDRKQGVDDVTGELNDYFLTSYDHHIKQKYGKERQEFVMEIQKYQPQHLYFFGHEVLNSQGQQGEIVRVHTTSHTPNDVLYAGQWWSMNNGLYNDNHAVNFYPPLPFSCIFYQSCGSYKSVANPNIRQVAFNTMGGTFFIGMSGDKPTDGDGLKMVNRKNGFYENICDKKQSYIIAFVNAKGSLTKTERERALPEFTRMNTIGMAHNPSYDVYRYISSNHYNLITNGAWIAKGSSKSMQYQHLYYTHTTNGAYVIVHGVLDNIITDTTASGTINIEIKRWAGQYANPQWVPINQRSSTSWVVKNRYNGIYYGGSDICSVYINANDMYLYLQVTVTFTSADPNTLGIQLDRFEVMEIGK